VSLDSLRLYTGLDVVQEAPIIQMIADTGTPRPSARLMPVVWSERRAGVAASRRADPSRPARARMSSANISAFVSLALSPPWLAKHAARWCC
jgi:hypothetical protein